MEKEKQKTITGYDNLYEVSNYGSGDLFVHGSYEAIKRVQNMIFELEKLKSNQPVKQSLEEVADNYANQSPRDSKFDQTLEVNAFIAGYNKCKEDYGIDQRRLERCYKL